MTTTNNAPVSSLQTNAEALLSELRECMTQIREAEISLANAQQRYIQFVTTKLMQYEEKV